MKYSTNPLSYSYIKNKFIENNIPINKESIFYFSNKKLLLLNNKTVEDFKYATEKITEMIYLLIEDFRNGDYLELYDLDNKLKEMVIESFKKDILGIRLDWGLENNIPKLFEINAESCGFLTECSLIPRWLNEVGYKSIDCNLYENYCEMLMKNHDFNKKLYLGALDYIYDIQNLHWIKKFIKNESLEIINLNEIEEHDNGYFYREQKIENLHKIYPWEWIIEDSKLEYFKNTNTTEPIWSILFNSKLILYILIKKFKNNSLLLETYYNEKVKGSFIEKQLSGMQGSSVIKSSGKKIWTKSILQRKLNPIKIEKDNLIFNTWIINKQFNGLGVKSDSKLISNDNHKFIPFSLEY